MSRHPHRTVHVIRDPKQLRALRTPTRTRVMNAIREFGRCSVREVADRLDWKPESLYYHVKALRDAGLVRTVGSRPSGARSEALYEPIKPEIALDQRIRSPEYLSAVWDVYRASLRASERDLKRALHDEEEGRGPRRNAMLQQFTVHLSPSKAKRLRTMLDEVGQSIAENEDPAASEAVSLTMVLSRIRRR